MADLAPFQVFRRRLRRSRGSGLRSEAPLHGPAPSPGVVSSGFVTPAPGGWLRWFERRGIEVCALFGWVGNGR